MKKILLATKNQSDTTSFLRAMGAFTEDSLRDIVECVKPPENYTWPEYWSNFLGVDIVYLHRPHSEFDRYLIDKTKLYGIPLWVDHDDDLENITPDNPVYSTYSKAKDIIQYSYQAADVLTVSGQEHYERLKKEYPNQIIGLIENGLDDRLLGMKRDFKFSRKVSWRGSLSHTTDLLFYNEAICEVMEKRSDYKFRYFGVNPYWLEFQHRKVTWEYIAPMNLFEFLTALTDFNAAFHWVALIDTKFNRVKSNLGWIDGTLAGSVTLGPDLPEYRKPGVALYAPNNKSDFLREFSGMFRRSESELKEMHKNSWNWICDNLLLSKLNKLRREIILNL